MTPRGLKSPSDAIAALAAAVSAVEKEHGAADVAWGKVNRLRMGTLDLPANGGPGNLGVFRVVGFDRGTASRRRLLRCRHRIFAARARTGFDDLRKFFAAG